MKLRISTQLIIASVLISVTVIALLSYLLISAHRRSLIAQMERHSHEYIETIRSSTRYAMMHNQREELQEIVNAIGSQPTVAKVRILNKEGTIVYSPLRVEADATVDMEAEACLGCHAQAQPRKRLEREDWSRFFTDSAGRPYIGIINPIYNEPACTQADCHAHPAGQTVLGVLDVTLSLAEVEKEARDSRNKAIALAAVTILFTSAIFLLLLHTRVGKPVGALLAATRRVGEGDLSSPIEIVRHDELGQLQASFNQMTTRIAETQNLLYQSNKLASVGRLAAGIAHEINNPLTGVLTFSSLLLKQEREDPELRESLETIVKETKRCRGIVKGLLDFSRQVPPRKQSVSLNEVVQRALDIVDHQLTVSNVRVTKTLTDDLPAVRVDPNQVQQVLLNLLVNASDAVPEGKGEIFIATRESQVEGRRYAEVKIADNGVGIPHEDQAKIFEPFFTTKEGGTGLGLAVVWGIVSEHGGTVEVSSQPGRGATFIIRLPINGSNLAPEETPGVGAIR